MSNVNQPQYREEQKPLVREVQRKANAGERIKIVAAEQNGGYTNGDIFTVTDANRWKYAGYGQAVTVSEVGIAIYHREYVVLEPIAPAAPVTASLPDLFAQFIRENAPAVRSYLAELDPVESAEADVEAPQPSPPTLTRAKVIEMARERVAELERIGGDRGSDLAGSVRFCSTFYTVVYEINRDKRAVTALVYNTDDAGTRVRRKPDAVGVAKCAPDDVFNADIGKAIAAERALGLTMTDAYVNAPKPAEPLAGMVVQRKVHPYDNGIRTITKKHGTSTGYWFSNGCWDFADTFEIIDDTDAVYTESAAKAGEAA